MQKILITVQENDSVAATVFPANTENKLNCSVIVGPAAAVSQTYYQGFCEYLADAGFDVMSFDFRGVGQSKTRHIREYRDVGFLAWAEYDYPAVVNTMLEKFPDQKLFIIGHSVGGWMPGATRMCSGEWPRSRPALSRSRCLSGLAPALKNEPPRSTEIHGEKQGKESWSRDTCTS